MITKVIFICIASLFSADSVRDYEGYRVMRSIPLTEAGKHFLESEFAKNWNECSSLKAPLKLGYPNDMMCSNATFDLVKERIERAGMEVETLIGNVGALIKETNENNRRASRARREADDRRVDKPVPETMNWDSYQRYDTIINWMEQLAADNPSFITLTNMGMSHENRKILMMKIGTSSRGDQTRAIWVDGGIHAREWVAISTSTFLIDKIVNVFKTGDDSSCDVKAVQSVDWYIAPLLNPDGYEYSHTDDRMWRKNRSPPPTGSSCYGVDLNRNWDVIGFGEGVVSSNPCSETYKGTEANSEPETVAIAATIQQFKNNIRIYLSFHSYGQYWLTSWGYKTQLPVDNAKLVKLGRDASDALKTITPDREYTVGSAGAIFYIAGGASDDYAKAAAEIPYSFTVELPDTGKFGFILPPSEIIKVGNELWASTGPLALEAARHPLGPDPARKKEILEDQKLGLLKP